jgi:hypothetical protein
MYKKIVIPFIFIFSSFISSSYAYSPLPEDSALLNKLYDKIDILHEKSPENLEKTLNALEIFKEEKEGNEQVNYLLINSIKYINTKLNYTKMISREDADNEYKWDLTKIYSNNLEIEDEFTKLEGTLTKLISYK